MNKHQVVLYTSYLHIIGGIETFVINFLDLMSPYYDIAVICPTLPDEMEKRVGSRARLYRRQEKVSCETLIMVRMMDAIPRYITYEKSIRMCHACKSDPSWEIKKDCDRIVHVSKASKESFNSQGDVILNPLLHTDKKALLLVSVTRIPAEDKGKNAERMLKLAKKLGDKGIPFLWMNFSDAPLKNAPKGFVNVGTFQDLQPYIAKADYLVQLSDQEGFGYSVLEALMNQTAVICTNFSTTKELGVVDGKNGYIVPFDLEFDLYKLLKVPEFEYVWDNEKIKKKWTRLLNYKPKKRKDSKMVETICIESYTDMELDRDVKAGEILMMRPDRAKVVERAGYIRIRKL